MSKPKILFIDCETLPNITYGYNLYDYTKPDMIVKERAILSFSYKWMNDKTVRGFSILDTKEDPYSDAKIVERIVNLLNEADYVVAHYGDKFDLRMIRARALINGLDAPAPVSSIDTYKLAKKYFYFNANRLDYLGKLLGLGGKIKTGWELWQKCAEGDKKSIEAMLKYNKRDVELLEKVFLTMLPHVESKLNYKLFGPKTACPACGSSKVQRRGTIVTKIFKKQRYYCTDCGSWHIGKYEE